MSTTITCASCAASRSERSSSTSGTSIGSAERIARSGASAPRSRHRQGLIDGVSDHGGDRRLALASLGPQAAIPRLVDENLQAASEHTHTLACASLTEPPRPAGRRLRGGERASRYPYLPIRHHRPSGDAHVHCARQEPRMRAGPALGATRPIALGDDALGLTDFGIGAFRKAGVTPGEALEFFDLFVNLCLALILRETSPALGPATWTSPVRNGFVGYAVISTRFLPASTPGQRRRSSSGRAHPTHAANSTGASRSSSPGSRQTSRLFFASGDE